eukprot:UN02352
MCSKSENNEIRNFAKYYYNCPRCGRSVWVSVWFLKGQVCFRCRGINL